MRRREHDASTQEEQPITVFGTRDDDVTENCARCLVCALWNDRTDVSDTLKAVPRKSFSASERARAIVSVNHIEPHEQRVWSFCVNMCL